MAGDRKGSGPGDESRPVCACSALILREGRILLVKRAHEPHAGKWALPGGAVEAGERITEALVREVREETGLSAVPGSFVAFTELIAGGAGEKPAHHYIILTFKAGVEGGRLEPGTDAADARWFRLDELVGIELSETTVGLLRRAGLISINQ